MGIKKIIEIYQNSYQKYDDLYDYFLNYCGFQILATRLSIGYITFRVRDYNNLDEIVKRENVQYPKSSPYFSRIGKPNQIWFYISDGWKASLTEMLPSWYKKIKPGENIKVIISTWQIRQDINVLIIPDLDKINNVSNALNLDSHYNSDFWKLICRKFQSTTLEDKNIYEFTSAFANALITRAQYEGKPVDGIFYPSVQYKQESNVALIPSVVDNEKIILKDLLRTECHKSRILTVQGLPSYETVLEPVRGYFEPHKDEITWD